MRCSASGSTISPSPAWWPAPPRCFWSTGAPGREAVSAKASGPLPGGLARSRSALRLFGLVFLPGDFLHSLLGRLLHGFLCFLAGLLGGFFRRGFLSGLFGFPGFVRHHLLGGAPCGLLDLPDHGLDGFLGRVGGAADRVRRLFQNGCIVVHVIPQGLSKPQ